MRKTWCAVGVVAVLLMAAGVVQSGGSPEPRAVIDRAIKELGGEANLSKFKGTSMKGKGTYYGMGDGIPYTGEWEVMPPNKMRFTVESNANGQTFQFTGVVNGDKGWRKFNDDVKEMSKEEVAEEREHLYGDLVMTLVPLKDKGYQLASLGEVEVKGHQAIGVRVSHKGHRDVLIYFDKKSGLPVKSEMIVKDFMASGDKEITQEMFMSDYKEFEGVKHATKGEMTRDGKRYVDVEFTEIRPAEKLDDNLFGRP
jgi:hypothetical protein